MTDVLVLISQVPGCWLDAGSRTFPRLWIVAPYLGELFGNFSAEQHTKTFHRW